ncbi:hypothetical protein BH23VER1_BH23VER1_18340 [soil metagenome]
MPAPRSACPILPTPRPGTRGHRACLLAASFLVVAAVTATTADASQTINFGSTLNATNHQSDGSDMDATFTFELGVFGSFVPDEGNIDLWSANWTALLDSDGDPAAALYDPSPLFEGSSIRINNFEGSAQIVDNLSDPSTPYQPSTQAYIWGFTGREAGVDCEWILLSNAAWQLPAVSDDGMPSPFTLDWAVSDEGTFAILGAVNPSYATTGDPAHMQSALVRPQALLAPEPSTLLLVLLGLAALGRRRRPARRHHLPS